MLASLVYAVLRFVLDLLIVQRRGEAKLRAERDRLGGVIHEYERAAA